MRFELLLFPPSFSDRLTITCSMNKWRISVESFVHYHNTLTVRVPHVRLESLQSLSKLNLSRPVFFYSIFSNDLLPSSSSVFLKHDSTTIPYRNTKWSIDILLYLYVQINNRRKKKIKDNKEEEKGKGDLVIRRLGFRLRLRLRYFPARKSVTRSWHI